MAAAGLGLRAIHGAEMALEDGRHVTLLVEDATGWRNLCRIVTAAHEHDRDKDEPPPRVPFATLEEHAAGPRLPERLRPRGRPRRGRAAAAEGDLRRRPPAGRAATPVPARRPGAEPRASPSWRRAHRACPPSPPATSTPTRARAAPLQDAFVALRNHATLDASEPLRRGNFSHVLASPKAMEARFADDHPRALAQTRALADRLTFDLTQDLGYRYPGSEDPEASRTLAELCAHRFEERYPPGSPHRAKAEPAPRGGAARDRRARPARLLPPAPRHARARARGRRRGARAGHGARAAAARAAAAAPRCPRSSVTSPASRTSTRSPTSCSSGASSTRS